MGRKRKELVILPQNEERAHAFMQWYGQNINSLRQYIKGGNLRYDEDIFSDAFLKAYAAIGRTGTVVNNNTAYFLRTYRTTFLDSMKKATIHTISINDEAVYRNKVKSDRHVYDLAAPDFDAQGYEQMIELINNKVLEFIRCSYDEVAVALFEIYIGLLPNISCKRMSNMLGIPENKIWPAIGRIKKDVVNRFGSAYDTFRSGIDGL